MVLGPSDSLTVRERDVLKHIVEGMTNKEIGERLNMTVNTVKTHVKKIFRKLQVNGRVQLVIRVKELKIL